MLKIEIQEGEIMECKPEGIMEIDWDKLEVI